MMRSLLVLVFYVCSCSCLSLEDPLWEEFKVTFNKTYSSPKEEVYRRRVWLDNRKLVDQHNREADIGLSTFWLKINHLADMTSEEVYTVMNGLRVDVDLLTEDTTVNKGNNSEYSGEVPPRVDWRKKGYVTPVKYQGHCGGCYAFSTTGAIEGLHFKTTGRLVSLSEQNIIDCTSNPEYHNHGCHGGLMDRAFRYVKNNHGIDTESSYPYHGDVGRCRYRSYNRGAKIQGWVDVLPRGDEHSLKAAVATVGPVSVGIDSRSFWFHLYSHGVFSSFGCSSVHLSHAVLAVGYDTDPNGKDYWIVKNSWGKFWGEEGYVKMARNDGNMCGIASLASYPTL